VLDDVLNENASEVVVVELVLDSSTLVAEDNDVELSSSSPIICGSFITRRLSNSRSFQPARISDARSAISSGDGHV
jgi:hypothetical protein